MQESIFTEGIQAFNLVGLDIMWLISKMALFVINKMANVFVVNFITEEPWYLAM